MRPRVRTTRIPSGGLAWVRTVFMRELRIRALASRCALRRLLLNAGFDDGTCSLRINARGRAPLTRAGKNGGKGDAAVISYFRRLHGSRRRAQGAKRTCAPRNGLKSEGGSKTPTGARAIPRRAGEEKLGRTRRGRVEYALTEHKKGAGKSGSDPMT